jgi:hypothetical protein
LEEAGAKKQTGRRRITDRSRGEHAQALIGQAQGNVVGCSIWEGAGAEAAREKAAAKKAEGTGN